MPTSQVVSLNGIILCTQRQVLTPLFFIIRWKCQPAEAKVCLLPTPYCFLLCPNHFSISRRFCLRVEVQNRIHLPRQELTVYLYSLAKKEWIEGKSCLISRPMNMSKHRDECLFIQGYAPKLFTAMKRGFGPNWRIMKSFVNRGIFIGWKKPGRSPCRVRGSFWNKAGRWPHSQDFLVH